MNKISMKKKRRKKIVIPVDSSSSFSSSRVLLLIERTKMLNSKAVETRERERERETCLMRRLMSGKKRSLWKKNVLARWWKSSSISLSNWNTLLRRLKNKKEEEKKISICISDVLLSHIKCIELKYTILSSSIHVNERKRNLSHENHVHTQIASAKQGQILLLINEDFERREFFDIHSFDVDPSICNRRLGSISSICVFRLRRKTSLVILFRYLKAVYWWHFIFDCFQWHITKDEKQSKSLTRLFFLLIFEQIQKTTSWVIDQSWQFVLVENEFAYFVLEVIVLVEHHPIVIRVKQHSHQD